MLETEGAVRAWSETMDSRSCLGALREKWKTFAQHLFKFDVGKAVRDSIDDLKIA